MEDRPDLPIASDVTDVLDDELMHAFVEGDADAFDAIFCRHHVPVFNLASYMLRSRAEAEEVMQETFLAVARSAARYEARGRFRAWIMGIARNRCINRLSAERARRAAMAESGLERSRARSPAGNPAEPGDEGDLLTAVRSALGRLPERQREALVLHAMEGMGYAEVASALGAPLGTVKTLIHRARANIARELEGGTGLGAGGAG